MLTHDERSQTAVFLNRLQTDQGGYSNTPNTGAIPQATLSVFNSLEYFGLSPERPDDILSYMKSFYDRQTGAFLDPSTGKGNVLTSAVGLLVLHKIGATEFFKECLTATLKFMNLHASSREEHFMLMAVIDECKISTYPAGSIRFFRDMEKEDGTFGPSALHNAIAASALLRLGENLKNPDIITTILLAAQQEDGGFADQSEASDLWATYCAMRALHLLRASPDTTKLQRWIRNMRHGQGGYALPGDEPSANITYQCLSILHWISRPVIEAAKTGDVTELKKWLQKGGEPDVTDLEGWTPLMAASVRGQSEAVEFLLSDRIPGGKPANPKIRLQAADASPIYWAGQSGDENTAKALLQNHPEQLFDISRVNGHNLLLQAAFFGSEKHLGLAKWILENTGEILGIPDTHKAEMEAARLKLTTATNVRGYNGLTMSALWGNKPMEKLFSLYDKSTEADRKAYLQDLLQQISPPRSNDEKENRKQLLSDRCMEILSEGFSTQNAIPAAQVEEMRAVQKNMLEALHALLSDVDFDMNRLGGPLSQTPLIAAITGVNACDTIAAFRIELVSLLLKKGADPSIREKHPMGVDAVIRAAVLNHLDILKLLSTHMPPLAFAAALNHKPSINGQTALQDTVHRALTAPQAQLASYLEQIKWCISRGARYDIEDHTGTSPEKLAKQALHDSVYGEKAAMVLDALGNREWPQHMETNILEKVIR